ncbi:hypothetical protein ACOKV8_004581 [Vibrio parahaemolyticus]
MRKNTRTKVVREITATLLDSRLTDSELYEFCESILNGDNTMEDIALSVLGVLERSGVTPQQRLSNDELRVQDAVEYLRRHKVTKPMIFESIKDFHPPLGEHLIRRNYTVQKAIQLFMKEVSKRDFDQFMHQITNDEYLDMIMRRIDE